jgi:hypothetical protein
MGQQLTAESNSRKAAKYRGSECLNCGHPLDLSDRYCSYCSQINTNKQLSLKDFFLEFIGSIITYDSRLRFTIKDLLLKPGTITRNYTQGKRLKYANPFRFFLSVSIIYFLLQGLISTFSPENNTFTNIQTDTENDGIADSTITGFNVVPNNKQGIFTLSGMETEKDTIDKRKQKQENFVFISEAAIDSLPWGNRFAKRFSLYNNFYEAYEIKDPAKALDSLKHKNTSYNRWLYSKNESIERIKDNPFGFVNYMLGKIPFFLFFFIPVFAFFFWLLYSKKKYTYMEHMIFIFHIFSFLFLAMLFCLLPDLLIGDDIFTGILFVLIGPFYFYKALRNFYKQNRFITILKFVFLNVLFWISSSIAALIFFAVTAATY